MTISSFSYKSKYFFGATYGVCGLKNPTAKKKLCPFLENFSSCSTASVATIPSVCSSSFPSASSQLKVPPYCRSLNVFILYSSSLSLPHGFIV